jgi:hypothetical protein
VYYTWPATWTVQGGGRKTYPSRAAGAAGRDDQTERWTIASDVNAMLSVQRASAVRLWDRSA